jgi:hypothetical protein
MIANKKKFYTGLGMMIVFTLLLVGMFLPIFDGQNMLENSDNLYNKVSKASAYYIDDVLEDSDHYVGTVIDASITMASATEAEQTALLYEAGNAQTTVSGADLEISGDLGNILNNAAQDADMLYNNDADTLAQKYGYEGQRVIYNWNQSLVELDEYLKQEDLIDEAKAVAEVNEKAIQPAYNYYGIEPENVSEKAGIMVGSLFFYIFYTVLYGFALMFIFEGWGLKIGAH